MIKLTSGKYTLRQDESSESLLTLVIMPDKSIEKVFGVKLTKENIFNIVKETRRNNGNTR
jgi:hypothetical protein